MNDQPTQFTDLLKKGGPVAVILKQYLRPADGEGEPIFPPTYLMPTYRGRVLTLKDGETRVSVELPPFRQDGRKDEKSESQEAAGYNIDEFKDGSNVCEIDSPQSQANRMEPLFETIKDGKLVPQIKIKVGKEPAPVKLLEAGHRAADAVVRLSSLVGEFHEAFMQVRRGNHYELAQLAPTSILFGMWDSRGTQVKLPRIIKAEIRATNVMPLTKSAVFNPACSYTEAEAVNETHDVDTLSAEGMKHALASKKVGGVKVNGEIKRVVRINLVAIRDLRANKDGILSTLETEKLQNYVLGLALVAASTPLELDLREGCLLCGIDDLNRKGSIKLVMTDGKEFDFQLHPTAAETFAEAAARDFFGDKYEQKNRLEAVFESGVANEYLAMTTKEREKIARSGPITADAIRRFKEKGKDPLKLVSDAIKEAKKIAMENIKEAKKTDAQHRGKNALPVVVPNAFNSVSERLDALADDFEVGQPVTDIVAKLQQLIADDKDTAITFKALGEAIVEFNKQRKEGGAGKEPSDESDLEQA
jgi:CRISPR-associated protein Csb1